MTPAFNFPPCATHIQADVLLRVIRPGGAVPRRLPARWRAPVAVGIFVLCFGLKVAGTTLLNSQRESEFSPRPTTVNITVTPTRAGEVEPDPSDTTTLTGEAATALALQAKVGTLAASSVEVDGSEAVGADEVTFDVTIVRGKGCEG